LADKLTCLFTKSDNTFCKRKIFNKKYLIESSGKIDVLIINKLCDFFNKTNHFLLEVKDNKCLLINLKTPTLNDTDTMIKIIFELMRNK
jgi:hypothetical protein